MPSPIADGVRKRKGVRKETSPGRKRGRLGTKEVRPCKETIHGALPQCRASDHHRCRGHPLLDLQLHAIADIGVACVTPNLLEEAANIELIAFDFGVSLTLGQGENPALTVYEVSIRNSGAFPISYNLNVGFLS